MNVSCLVKKRNVSVNLSVIKSILEYSEACHPKEGILLLKGKVNKDRIVVEEVELPPLAVHGRNFSNFPVYMLPVDFSVIGTAHSHPTGVINPSITDLNNFYGRIMIIAAYPYKSKKNIAIFDANKNLIEYNIIDD